MANFNEQVMRSIEEFTLQTGQNAINPDDFITWALKNSRLSPRPEDIRTLLKRRVTSAMRQQRIVDEDGVEYRSMQCAVSWDESSGEQISLWFHTDTGGTPALRKKAVKQRRDAIADDVYRAVSDVVHMNKQHNENIQFVMDFTDDYLDRKAAEQIKYDLVGAA
jgi:hypothetical protein